MKNSDFNENQTGPSEGGATGTDPNKSQQIPQFHPIQWQILQKLVHSENLRFNEIKPKDMDPRQFVYHLNRLKEAGFIKHDEPNQRYSLTQSGKLIINYFDTPPTVTDLPTDTFISLYIVRDGQILVEEREKNPFFGHVGIPTFGFSLNQFSHERAEEALIALRFEGTFTRPLLLETIYEDSSGQAFRHTHMHVFYCDDATGESVEKYDEGKLFWMTSAELLGVPKGYEDTKTMIKHLEDGKFDKTLTKIVATRDRQAIF